MQHPQARVSLRLPHHCFTSLLCTTPSVLFLPPQVYHTNRTPPGALSPPLCCRDAAVYRARRGGARGSDSHGQLGKVCVREGILSEWRDGGGSGGGGGCRVGVGGVAVVVVVRGAGGAEWCEGG
jgi:hypothetical protein